MTKTKKAQVVLTDADYALLQVYARAQGTTVSSMLREALRNTLLPALRRQVREAALQRLFTQELPTDDWEIIERELEGRWAGHDPG